MARGWDSAYAAAPPPWDIGRPQPVVESIAAGGGFRGRILDVGCGTGENALFLAARGLQVVGLDWSERAIRGARAKATEREIAVEFVVGDATDLPAAIDTGFDSGLDSGLFHTFDDSSRAAYVRSLERVMASGGTLHILCFSELEPGDWGPRRVTAAEIRAAFAIGWAIRAIEPFRFATRLGPDGAHAWHATLERVGPSVELPSSRTERAHPGTDE